MRSFIHKELAQGKWFAMSLAEQMANIGSDVFRASKWRNKDDKLFNGAVDRALDLFDLTLEDSRWIGRRREIARAREIFCDASLGGAEYKTTLNDLNKYFLPFILAAGVERDNKDLRCP